MFVILAAGILIGVVLSIIVFFGWLVYQGCMIDKEQNTEK